ncbi:hypothetical protein PENNAL_c0769G05786 [Penicillium nalgiovense]|uniref:Uncharacterized protein n=1 Tax=Penicillium nalgiovense TaxID=60175 RepID=A0A1V6UM46_PENNA|nr:hypothetical protein PENNAL_c0769G05786 [Penicillium nalgiovense]
MNRLKTSVG